MTADSLGGLQLQGAGDGLQRAGGGKVLVAPGLGLQGTVNMTLHCISQSDLGTAAMAIMAGWRWNCQQGVGIETALRVRHGGAGGYCIAARGPPGS